MTTPTGRPSYLNVPLPTPPAKAHHPKGTVSDAVTEHIKNIAKRIKRNPTPHPNAIKKAVTKK